MVFATTRRLAILVRHGEYISTIVVWNRSVCLTCLQLKEQIFTRENNVQPRLKVWCEFGGANKRGALTGLMFSHFLNVWRLSILMGWRLLIENSFADFIILISFFLYFFLQVVILICGKRLDPGKDDAHWLTTVFRKNSLRARGSYQRTWNRSFELA